MTYDGGDYDCPECALPRSEHTDEQASTCWAEYVRKEAPPGWGPRREREH